MRFQALSFFTRTAFPRNNIQATTVIQWQALYKMNAILTGATNHFNIVTVLVIVTIILSFYAFTLQSHLA